MALPLPPLVPAPPGETPQPGFWRLHGLAGLGFLLLTCLMTFPAVLRLGSHVAASGDAFAFVWELWWFSHAIFTLHTNPLVTPLLFHPNPAMPLIWSTPVGLVTGVPLAALWGPVVAFNLVHLGGLALAGFGAYLLTHHLVGRRDAAFLAGAIFAFAPVHMGHMASGHMGVAAIQWTPFLALALFRLYEAPSLRRAALFAGTVALVAGTDLYIAVYFLGAFLALFAVYYGFKERARLLRRSFWLPAAAAFVLGLAAVAPFHLHTLAVLHGATTTTEQAATVHRFGQDLLQFVAPPKYHLLLGPLSASIVPRGWSGGWAYLGFSVIALAGYALGRVRGSVVAFWGLFVGGTLLLSLGTTLKVGGATGWPLPYMVATWLPVLSSFRVPDRFALFAMLGLGVLVAFAVARLREKSRRAWLTPLVLGLVVFEYLYLPYPTRPASIPSYYQALAAEPGAGAVLELPTGDSTWGVIDHQWMYYQTLHQRPLVYAHTHRIPDGMLDFVHRTPVLHALTRLMWTGGRLELTPAQRAAAAGQLQAAGITHVILHRMPGYLDGERYERLSGELAAMFGEPAHQDEGLVVFRPAHAQGSGASTR